MPPVIHLQRELYTIELLILSLRRAVASDAAVHEHQICPMSGQQAYAPAGTSRKRRREPVRQPLVSAFTPATGEICMKWRK